MALGEALEAALQNMRQSEDLQEAVEALRTEDWVEPRWPKIEDCNVDWCGEFQPIQKEDSEEPIKAARPGRNRGAKPKYDWNGLETALTFLLNKHGNPLTDAASCAAGWRSQNDIIRATFRRARTALPAKPNGQIKSKFAEMMMRWDDLNCLPAPPGGDRKMTTA